MSPGSFRFAWVHSEATRGRPFHSDSREFSCGLVKVAGLNRVRVGLL